VSEVNKIPLGEGSLKEYFEAEMILLDLLVYTVLPNEYVQSTLA
jgi:hypothetical protein